MNKRDIHLKLPTAFTVGSFLCLVLLASLTSPVDKVSHVMFFFLLVFVFLFSGGYSLMALRSSPVSRKIRSRLLIISASLTLLLMLKSTGSLTWVDSAVLLLISIGLLFYSGRRADLN